jgi:hypothetical protein
LSCFKAKFLIAFIFIAILQAQAVASTLAMQDGRILSRSGVDSSKVSHQMQPSTSSGPSQTFQSTDPLQIFLYVRNNFTFESYYGYMKGPAETVNTMGGNDMDQAALLVRLLRQANLQARYVFGTITLNLNELGNWLGIKTQPAARRVLAEYYPDYQLSGLGPNSQFTFKHVWVEAYINGAWVQMDPGFKQYTYHNSTVTYESGQPLLNQLSSKQVGPYGLSNLDTTPILNAIKYGDEKAAQAASSPNPSLLPYRTIIPVQNYSVPPNLIVGGRFNEIPSSDEYFVEVTIPTFYNNRFNFDAASITVRHPTPLVSDSRISLYFVPVDNATRQYIHSFPKGMEDQALITSKVQMFPVLKLNSTRLIRGGPMSLGQFMPLNLRILRGDQEIFRLPAAGTFSVQVGTWNSLVVNTGDIHARSDNILLNRIQQLNQTARLMATHDTDMDDILGAIFDIQGHTYFDLVNIVESQLQASFGVHVVHTVGVALTGYSYNLVQNGTWTSLSFAGPFINIPGGVISRTVSATNNTSAEQTYNMISSIVRSSFEGQVIHLLYQTAPVSTGTLLEAANEQGVPIYIVDKNNWATVQSQLNQPESVINSVKEFIDSGMMAVVPQHPVTTSALTLTLSQGGVPIQQYSTYIGTGWLPFNPNTWSLSPGRILNKNQDQTILHGGGSGTTGQAIADLTAAAVAAQAKADAAYAAAQTAFNAYKAAAQRVDSALANLDFYVDRASFLDENLAATYAAAMAAGPVSFQAAWAAYQQALALDKEGHAALTNARADLDSAKAALSDASAALQAALDAYQAAQAIANAAWAALQAATTAGIGAVASPANGAGAEAPADAISGTMLLEKAGEGVTTGEASLGVGLIVGAVHLAATIASNIGVSRFAAANMFNNKGLREDARNTDSTRSNSSTFPAPKPAGGRALAVGSSMTPAEYQQTLKTILTSIFLVQYGMRDMGTRSELQTMTGWGAGGTEPEFSFCLSNRDGYFSGFNRLTNATSFSVPYVFAYTRNNGTQRMLGLWNPQPGDYTLVIFGSPTRDLNLTLTYDLIQGTSPASPQSMHIQIKRGSSVSASLHIAYDAKGIMSVNIGNFEPATFAIFNHSEDGTVSGQLLGDTLTGLQGTTVTILYRQATNYSQTPTPVSTITTQADGLFTLNWKPPPGDAQIMAMVNGKPVGASTLSVPFQVAVNVQGLDNKPISMSKVTVNGKECPTHMSDGSVICTINPGYVTIGTDQLGQIATFYIPLPPAIPITLRTGNGVVQVTPPSTVTGIVQVTTPSRTMTSTLQTNNTPTYLTIAGVAAAALIIAFLVLMMRRKQSTTKVGSGSVKPSSA